MHRVRDYRVRETRLERRGNRVPRGLFEDSQKSPIEHACVPAKPDKVRIRTVEAHELWIRINESGERPDEAIEPNERPVTVAGDGQPLVRRPGRVPRPAPLIGMTIPIPDEHIEQPGNEQRARIDALVGVLLEAREQLLGAEDTGTGGKARDVTFVILLSWTELEKAKRAAEVFAVFAQQRVIGEDHEARCDVKHLRRIEEPGDDESAGGML